MERGLNKKEGLIERGLSGAFTVLMIPYIRTLIRTYQQRAFIILSKNCVAICNLLVLMKIIIFF